MVLETVTSNVVFNQMGLPGLQGIDFYGFLLPWIFSFAIVYGLLSKLSIFGEKAAPKVNIALSFVIAFFVTGIAGTQLATFFTSLFGGASIFLAGILVIILFAAMLGQHNALNKTAAVIVVIIIGVVLFLSSSGTIVGRVWVNSQTASLLFWLVIIIVAAYLITREGKHESAPEKKS